MTAEEFCEVCDRLVAPLIRGVCPSCWVESVESGVHAWSELPAEIRDRSAR